MTGDSAVLTIFPIIGDSNIAMTEDSVMLMVCLVLKKFTGSFSDDSAPSINATAI